MTRAESTTDPTGSAAEVERSVVRMATLAVYAVFFLSGFNFANWAARLPLVRDLLGFAPAQMGRMVLVGAIGSIIALPLSGWIIQRFGGRLTLAVFTTVTTVGYALAALGVARDLLPVVIVGLFCSGVGMGVWDAAMNLEGGAVEQRLGRAIMPRFHAAFSFGTMAGAGVAALASALKIGLVPHISGAVLLSLGLVFVSLKFLLPGASAAAAAPDVAGPADLMGGPSDVIAIRPNPFGAWRERRTLLIGLVVLAAALTEGAANDWVGLAVVDDFNTDHTLGAVALMVFLSSMTAMRLLGTSLIDRRGRVFVLRLSAGLAIGGLGIFGLSPWLPVAIIGVLAWGMGAALGFPIGMSAASDEPTRAAGRLAVVATIGYTAFFAGPPIIGEIANHIGYRNALLAIAIPVLAGLLVAGAAATPAERAPRDTDSEDRSAADLAAPARDAN